MRRLLIAMSLLACLALSTPAHADTFPIATFLTSGLLLGNLTIDPVTGVASSGDFTIVSNGTTFVFSGADVNFSGPFTSDTYFLSFVDTTGLDSFSLLLPTTTLVGYNGSPHLCSLTFLCDGLFVSGFFDNSSPNAGLYQSFDGGVGGSKSLVPEPASLMLLATGVTAAVGVFRRRILRA
jgi:hypothetical protein